MPPAAWSEKIAMCLWSAYKTQAQIIGVIPVQVKPMKPMPAWRAYGTNVLMCVIWILYVTTNYSLTHIQRGHFVLLALEAAYLYSFYVVVLVNIAYNRRSICVIMQSLSSYCRRHPLAASCWTSIVSAAMQSIAAFLLFAAWVVDTYINFDQLRIAANEYCNAVFFLFTFLQALHVHIFTFTVLLPFVMLGMLFSELYTDCLEGLLATCRQTTIEKNLSEDINNFFWREIRNRHQLLVDMWLCTRTIMQWSIVLVASLSLVLPTLHVSDYIGGQHKTVPDRSKLQLAHFLTVPIHFITLCLAFQRVKSENSRMRKAIFNANLQLKIADLADEVEKFDRQISFYEEGAVCTVLWIFDLDSKAIIKVIAFITYNIFVMRQSDVQMWE